MWKEIVQDIDTTLLLLNEDMRKCLEYGKEKPWIANSSKVENMKAYASAVQALAEYRGKLCVIK